MRGQQIAHRLSEPCRAETVLAIAIDVLALLDPLDDRRIGRWATDAVLLQLLHQRRLGESRFRFRLVCNRLGARHRASRSFDEVWELRLGILVLVVLPFQVDGGEPRLQRTRRRCLQSIVADAPEERRGRRELVRHLRGDRAPPDQRVDLELAIVEVGRNNLGSPMETRRPNRLVRLLCVLRLRCVLSSALDHGLGTEAASNDLRGFADRLLAQRRRIGAHVCDESGALTADVDAFVEFLSQLHRDPRAIAVLASGLLLKRRRGEGGHRSLLSRALAALGHDGRSTGDPRNRGRRHIGLQLETLPLRPNQARRDDQLRICRWAHPELDGAVEARDEGSDRALALHDQAKRNRLHASGRGPRRD